MAHYDLAVDFMDMTNDRRLLTHIEDATPGLVPVVGTYVVVGDEDAAPAVARILAVEAGGNIDLEILPGSVADHRDLRLTDETQTAMVQHRVLWRSGAWQVVRPAYALTEAHLVLAFRGPTDADHLPREAAHGFLQTYRAVESGLAALYRCDRFGLSLAYRWTPYGAAVGEPIPEFEGAVQPAVHVFGRYPQETIKPVRTMALPASRRKPPLPPDQR